jgi:hypothetical protein
MNEEQEKTLKVALWLAYDTSTPMGLGFLVAATAPKFTIDSLWNKYKDSVTEFKDGNVELYTDYVEGRMMKTIFSVNKNGLLTINGNQEPRSDYQSWCRQCPTNRELVNAVKLHIHLNH